MGYGEAVIARRKYKDELEELEREYSSRKNELERLIAEQERLCLIHEEGLDENASEMARGIIQVRWDSTPSGLLRLTPEVKGAFAEAVEDCRNGFPILTNRYLGVKSYARWDSQREDHLYGNAPAYGYHWFSIKLSWEYRQKLDEGHVPTETEKASCAYLLDQLRSSDNRKRELLLGR